MKSSVDVAECFHQEVHASWNFKTAHLLYRTIEAGKPYFFNKRGCLLLVSTDQKWEKKSKSEMKFLV